MTLLDANVLLLDQRYQRDPNYPTNRRFLDAVAAGGVPVGAMAHAFYETIGVLSFQLSARSIAALPGVLQAQYRLTVIPAPDPAAEYAGCTYAEIQQQIERKMALGDAVVAIQLHKFAPAGSEFVTWDAPHFVGKVAVPVLTPADWLAARAPNAAGS